MRSKSISRQTAETKINLDFAIDGSGTTNIKTGVGLFRPYADTIHKSRSIRFDS